MKIQVEKTVSEDWDVGEWDGGISGHVAVRSPSGHVRFIGHESDILDSWDWPKKILTAVEREVIPNRPIDPECEFRDAHRYLWQFRMAGDGVERRYFTGIWSGWGRLGQSIVAGTGAADEAALAFLNRHGTETQLAKRPEKPKPESFVRQTDAYSRVTIKTSFGPNRNVRVTVEVEP